MSIGSRIRSERKSQNLTMKKLSEMADISISYLGDIEKDRSRPSIERLKDIAKALDRSIAYFIDEDNLGEDESVYLSVDEETKELLTSLLPDEGFLDILRSIADSLPAAVDFREVQPGVIRLKDKSALHPCRNMCRGGVVSDDRWLQVASPLSVNVRLGVDRRNGARVLYRVHIQQHPSGSSAQENRGAAGDERGSCRCRLQCQPEHDRHRFRRTPRQRLSGRDPDHFRIRAGAEHRFHFLYRRGGMGIPRLSCRDLSVRVPDFQNHHGRGEKPGGVHQNIRLLCGLVHIHALVHQHRDDHRHYACDRHPIAAAQLWRLLAVGIHRADLHIHSIVSAREEILLAVQTVKN